MTPAARLQAAIELVDQISDAARSNGAAADTLIARWFKTRRYAGGKDRAAIRELTYQVIRAFGEAPVSARAAVLGIGGFEPLFDGIGYGPAVMTPDELVLQPSALAPWLAALIPEDEHDALLGRASFDLRVNHARASRAEVLAAFDDAEPIGGTEHGVRLPRNVTLDQHRLYLDGKIEVQDAGSQMIIAACAAQPGQTVIDLCAGAGGKTLGLAADMAGQGRLIACDTDRARLSKLAPRAERAGAEGEMLLLNPGEEAAMLADLQGRADLVLIDAPCSGSGTWRRNPEARWRVTPASLEVVTTLQRRVLAIGADLVKPGGTLVFAVCSLIEHEGRDQIDEFLAVRRGWTAEPPSLSVGRPHGSGWRLSPAHDGCDGFFIARLKKPC